MRSWEIYMISIAAHDVRPRRQDGYDDEVTLLAVWPLYVRLTLRAA